MRRSFFLLQHSSRRPLRAPPTCEGHSLGPQVVVEPRSAYDPMTPSTRTPSRYVQGATARPKRSTVESTLLPCGLKSHTGPLHLIPHAARGLGDLHFLKLSPKRAAFDPSLCLLSTSSGKHASGWCSSAARQLSRAMPFCARSPGAKGTRSSARAQHPNG